MLIKRLCSHFALVLGFDLYIKKKYIIVYHGGHVITHNAFQTPHCLFLPDLYTFGDLIAAVFDSFMVD